MRLQTKENHDNYQDDLGPSTDSITKAPVPGPDDFFQYIQNLEARVDGLEAENNILRAAMAPANHCRGCNCENERARDALTGDGFRTDTMNYDGTSSPSYPFSHVHPPVSGNTVQELEYQLLPIPVQPEGQYASLAKDASWSTSNFDVGASGSSLSFPSWNFKPPSQPEQAPWQPHAAQDGQDAQLSMHNPAYPQTESLLSVVTSWQRRDEPESQHHSGGVTGIQDLYGDTDMERSHEMQVPHNECPPYISPHVVDEVQQAILGSLASDNIDGIAERYPPQLEDTFVEANQRQENTALAENDSHNIAEPEPGTLPTYPAALPSLPYGDIDPYNIAGLYHDSVSVSEENSFGLPESFDNAPSTGLVAAKCAPEQNSWSYTLSDALGTTATVHTTVLPAKSSIDELSPSSSAGIIEPGPNSGESSSVEALEGGGFWEAARRTWDNNMLNKDKANIMVSFAEQNKACPGPFFSKTFNWQAARQTVNRMGVDDPNWVWDFVSHLQACARDEDKPFLQVGPWSSYNTVPGNPPSFYNGGFHPLVSLSPYTELGQPNGSPSTADGDHGERSSPINRKTDEVPLQDFLVEPQDFSGLTQPSWMSELTFSEPLSSTVTEVGNITGESSSSTAIESPRSLASSSTVLLEDDWLSQEQWDEKFCRDTAVMGLGDDLPSQPQPM
jgi:hypothetical protein